MAKVLLAEDDEFSRDMLMRRLERNGYEVLAAADGREAVRSARLHRPDLILMDLDMPVMDGRAAIRAIKGDPQTTGIPIIVLTAYTSVRDVADALKAGCQGYEAKPVVLRRLIGRIEELLQSNGHT
ncbi:MAG TPA: response regulator [Bryobacteraceae bacterium]|jgi:CheY-like chemotaxis protein